MTSSVDQLRGANPSRCCVTGRLMRATVSAKQPQRASSSVQLGLGPCQNHAGDLTTKRMINAVEARKRNHSLRATAGERAATNLRNLKVDQALTTPRYRESSRMPRM